MLDCRCASVVLQVLSYSKNESILHWPCIVAVFRLYGQWCPHSVPTLASIYPLEFADSGCRHWFTLALAPGSL
jgi:hypothetical protein